MVSLRSTVNMANALAFFEKLMQNEIYIGHLLKKCNSINTGKAAFENVHNKEAKINNNKKINKIEINFRFGTKLKNRL